MKLALWCDMELAEGLITYLPQDLHIVCIIDENLSVQGQMLGQVPVISFDDFHQGWLERVEGAFVCIGGGTRRMQAVKKLQYYGIKHIGFPKLYRAFDVSSEGIVWNDGRPYLSQAEIHIMDSCNLNCSGCTHFSNLYGTNTKYDFNQYLMDLRILSRRVFERLLPLLDNPIQLCRFCSESPRVFQWKVASPPAENDWLS